MPTSPGSGGDPFKDRFAAEYEQGEPDPQAALTRPTDEIVTARKTAAQRFGEHDNLLLSAAQRQALSGKRIPELDHIAELLGRALTNNGELAKKMGLPGKLFLDGAAQDRAAGRVVMAGQRMQRGGELGSLLCAATMEALCERVFAKVRATLASREATLEQRSDVEISFSEAFRQKAAAEARAAAAAAQLERVAEGPRAEIDRAAQQAEGSRLIEAFLRSIQDDGQDDGQNDGQHDGKHDGKHDGGAP